MSSTRNPSYHYPDQRELRWRSILPPYAGRQGARVQIRNYESLLTPFIIASCVHLWEFTALVIVMACPTNTISDNLYFAPHLIPFHTKHNPHVLSLGRISQTPEFFRYTFVSVVAAHRLASCRDGQSFSRMRSTSYLGAMAASTSKASDLDYISSSLTKGDYKEMFFASQSRMLRSLADRLGDESSKHNQFDPFILCFITMMILTQVSAYDTTYSPC